MSVGHIYCRNLERTQGRLRRDLVLQGKTLALPCVIWTRGFERFHPCSSIINMYWLSSGGLTVRREICEAPRIK